jgi:hypothetical protein
MFARTAAPTVRAADLSPSIVLKQVSLFLVRALLPATRRRTAPHAFARRELKLRVRRGEQDSNLRPLVPPDQHLFPDAG